MTNKKSIKYMLAVTPMLIAAVAHAESTVLQETSGAAPIEAPSAAAVEAFRQAHPEAFGVGGTKPGAGISHDIPHPLGIQRREDRQQALQAELNGAQSSGKVTGKNRVGKIPGGQYVELERTGEELIWTVVAEFADNPSPFFGGAPGPQKNEIPQPGPNDNTTIWRADFNRDYYMDMLFNDAAGANSMRNYYKEISSNRYTVDGDVTDWTSVPFNTAHYGTPYCGGNVCATTWWFVRDAVDGWYADQLAAGKTPAEIDDYLSQFDVWDRYDHDGDGDFDEPDGYIDHFQAVHAGEGAETGGGAYGSAAIWSHRWYVQLTGIGAGGPILDDGTSVPLGGTPIGGSKYWIGDYTVEPENGAVGVFAHEYAHDLGLPDLYNTAGGPSNATGMWTLMSSGSYGSDGTVDIGSKPTHMGAWEKLQLGWLDFDVAVSGVPSDHKLGPATYNSRHAQGLIVIAPPKEVIENIGTPFSGSYLYYSGSGNSLDNSMSRSVTLPGGAVSLTAMVNYDIESDWDYAYLTVNGVSVATDHSTVSDPNGQNFGFGITGASGGWVALTADLSAFAGQTVDIGFRYWTDGFVENPGLQVDDIQISGQPLDDAESDFGWNYAGFRMSTGTDVAYYDNYYIAAYRQYRGYDESLETGPYVFGFGGIPGLENTVDHFPFQDGLLISYWDTSQDDNNTSTHPGEGLVLPVDAHPEPLLLGPDTAFPGAAWFGSIQTMDSTFSKQNTDAFALHYNGVPTSYPSRPGVAEFDANNEYYLQQAAPHHAVNPPKSDTIIRIKSGGPKSSFLQVQVR